MSLARVGAQINIVDNLLYRIKSFNLKQDVPFFHACVNK